MHGARGWQGASGGRRRAGAAERAGRAVNVQAPCHGMHGKTSRSQHLVLEHAAPPARTLLSGSHSRGWHCRLFMVGKVVYGPCRARRLGHGFFGKMAGGMQIKAVRDDREFGTRAAG